LPAALTAATLRTVVRFAFTRVPIPGSDSATSLAQGVLRSMAMTRWLKVGSFLLVLGVTLAGADLLAQKALPDGEPPSPVQAKSKHAYGSPVSVQEVKPGKLKILVFEQGTIVPVGEQYVWNQVEGSRTISSILSEGAQVKNGQIVCELDASDLRTKLTALVGSGKGGGPEAARLRTQIERCRIEAPRDGYVVHCNDPDYPEHGRDIEEGATVRERQLLFRILDPEGPVQVRTEIPESLLVRVRSGQAVRLRFDAFETFTGTVASIAPLASPKKHLSRDDFRHRAFLSIDERPAWLRAGMIGQVEVLIPELEDVLSVPRGAVVYYDGRDHVAVKRPDGGFDWREVTLGGHGARHIEIQQGIRSGENVVLNPYALMSPEERNAKLGPGPRENPNGRR
jgi:multidrug efflux pump subunit AcrA (membrane-fusion protein)